jgi:hypothetical protein
MVGGGGGIPAGWIRIERKEISLAEDMYPISRTGIKEDDTNS